MLSNAPRRHRLLLDRGRDRGGHRHQLVDAVRDPGDLAHRTLGRGLDRGDCCEISSVARDV